MAALETTRGHLINIVSCVILPSPIVQPVGETHGPRPHERPMGVHRTSASGAAQAGGRARPPLAGFAGGAERSPLDPAHWGAVVGDAGQASAAPGPPPPLPAVAQGGRYGPAAGGAGRGADRSAPGRAAEAEDTGRPAAAAMPAALEGRAPLRMAAQLSEADRAVRTKDRELRGVSQARGIHDSGKKAFMR